LQLAQRGDWSGLLCYRKAPGCLLAAGCCVQCPASPPRPMPEETTGRMNAFIRFVSLYKAERTVQREAARPGPLGACETTRWTVDTRRIRSNVLRQRRAPFQVAPSHDEKRGDGTAALDIFAPGSNSFPAALSKLGRPQDQGMADCQSFLKLLETDGGS